MTDVSYGFFWKNDDEDGRRRPIPTAHLFIIGTERTLRDVIAYGEVSAVAESDTGQHPICRKCLALAKSRFPGES